MMPPVKVGGLGPNDPLTKLEYERIIRACRKERDEMVERKLLLQERGLTLGDGVVAEALLALENDSYVLTAAIAKLWVMMLRPP